MREVPRSHQELLAAMPWVYETRLPNDQRLIAVHAGLVSAEDVEQQLRMLRARDVTIPRVSQLSERKSVWDMPEELQKDNTILVSGHHGVVHCNGNRFIVDSGQHSLRALVFPSQVLVDEHGAVTPVDQ